MGTLKKSQSNLERAEVVDAGNPPWRGENPLAELMSDYYEQWLDRDERPTATGTRLRASWAGRCARQIHYRLIGAPAEPPDLPGAWSMDRGKIVHALLDEFAMARGWQIETPVVVSEHISAHVDFFDPVGRRAMELKTTGGYSFKMKATPDRGAPEGPAFGDVLQGALGAYALDADELYLGIVSMESVAKYLAAKHDIDDFGRIAAVWRYDKATITRLATEEIRRLTEILETTDAKFVPLREIPLADDKVVTITDRNGSWIEEAPDTLDPGSSVVVDAGKTWHCDYCPFADTCWAE